MTIIIILISLVYTILIGAFIVGFFKLSVFHLKGLTPTNSFSIIIPFRNEAQNLPQLLKSIALLKYPKDLFEIILIDDASEDNFSEIINSFILENELINIRIANNERKSNSPKKDAINTGILCANFDWIITTDADCIVPSLWLQTYNEFIERNNIVFIAGPVTFNTKHTFLDKFQLLDFSALIGSTVGSFGIGKPFLCNGANLCYQKKAFNSVNGFEGNDGIASGDDIFLLEKMNEKFPRQTGYVKSLNALVGTTTMKSVQTLFSQRVRWASKASNYTYMFAQFVSLVIILMNLLFCCIVVAGFLNYTLTPLMINIVLLKVIVDFILIGLALHFKKKLIELIYYPIVAIIHPFFNLVIGCMTLINTNYIWKDRSFHK